MIHLFQEAFQFLRMGYASAMAWLLFVIILVVTLVQVKLSNRFVFYEGGGPMSDSYHEVANRRRTRLAADWHPHQCEAREYPVTDGPVANARRSRAEKDPEGGAES